MNSSPADSGIKRPPLNPDVAAALDAMAANGIDHAFTPEFIQATRQSDTQAEMNDDLDGLNLEELEFTVPGYQGAEIAVTVLRRRGHTGVGPGIFHLHAGGMVVGTRMTGVSLAAPWVVAHDAVLATVEYRLAPEYPDPVPVEDSYAALLWFAENAGKLGVDPAQILIVGASGGGGLAAGVSLLSRDRGGPALIGQMLLCPMLDDRDDTVSARQFDEPDFSDRSSNNVCWDAVLGDRRGTDRVSAYAAPARAEDLSDLPPTYLDAGGAEVFRDETVAYASRLWRDGNDTELHIWPGGTHGWEVLVPGTPLALLASDVRSSWVARLFAE